VKLYWLDKYLVYCHWPKYSFSGTPVTCYLLSFGKLVVNPVHFPVKYQKDQTYNCIILLFNSKYKRLWSHVIFLQDKHNMNAVFWDVKVYVYSLVKGYVYLDFVLIIKPHTHELYILRHWTNIVDIQDCCKVIRVCFKYWMSCS